MRRTAARTVSITARIAYRTLRDILQQATKSLAWKYSYPHILIQVATPAADTRQTLMPDTTGTRNARQAPSRSASSSISPFPSKLPRLPRRSMRGWRTEITIMIHGTRRLDVLLSTVAFILAAAASSLFRTRTSVLGVAQL